MPLSYHPDTTFYQAVTLCRSRRVLFATVTLPSSTRCFSSRSRSFNDSPSRKETHPVLIRKRHFSSVSRTILLTPPGDTDHGKKEKSDSRSRGIATYTSRINGNAG